MVLPQGVNACLRFGRGFRLPFAPNRFDKRRILSKIVLATRWLETLQDLMDGVRK